MKKFELTAENYYTPEANQRYMSVSQYKQFVKCEAAAMAEIAGEWHRPETTALLVGSYVDAWYEGTQDAFIREHSELFKRDGMLKADYAHADKIIEQCQCDDLFTAYMAGEKQRIFTAELFGTEWKIKVDSLHPDKIVDLKVVRSLERVMGRSFVEHWWYDGQMAIYAEVERRSRHKEHQPPEREPALDTYLAVATKEDPINLEIVYIPAWRHKELLEDVQRDMPHILAVKQGDEPAQRCGMCEYCRSTKVLTQPLDFELVGLTTREQNAVMGVKL